MALFTYRSFNAFDRLELPAFDLGIFDQAVWLISHGQRPFVTVRGCHILADHFSPILYLFAPLYWIWPSAKLLCLVQTAALAAGALPLYGAARHRGMSSVSALVLALVYLGYPAVQWTTISDFHPECLAPVLILAALYFLDRQNWRAYAICLVFAALTKETIGVSILFFGCYVLRVNRRAGRWTIAGGLGFWVLALATIRFASNGAPSPYWSLYAPYGGSLSTVSWYFVTHPSVLAANFNSPEIRGFLFQLLYPLLFLPLAAPEVLVAALPATFAVVLWNRPKADLLESHYSTLIFPFLFGGLLIGFDRIRRAGTKRTTTVITCLLCVAMLDAATYWPASSERQTYPLDRSAAAFQLLAGVPPDASITAPARLVPHLTHRTLVYDFPNPFLSVAYGLSAQALQQEFGREMPSYTAQSVQAAVDAGPVEYVTLTIEEPVHIDCAAAALASPSYGIVDIKGGAILLRRGAPHEEGLRRFEATFGGNVSSLKGLREDLIALRDAHTIR